MMKMAPLARALAADFSIQPLAFSLSLVFPLSAYICGICGRVPGFTFCILPSGL